MSKKSVTNLECKLISSTETYPVRHAVLRKGRPIESCAFEGDNLETTFHLGGFKDSKLIAVASFFKNNNTQHQLNNAIQLRGMAVLDEFHGQGHGKALLSYGENLSKQKASILWMNARINAVDFYSKLKYQKLGIIFEIPQVGEHYVMFKQI